MYHTDLPHRQIHFTRLTTQLAHTRVLKHPRSTLAKDFESASVAPWSILSEGRKHFSILMCANYFVNRLIASSLAANRLKALKGHNHYSA